MNIIVDSPQLVRVVLLYLNKNFGNLTPKISEEGPEYIKYVDSYDETIIEYDKERNEAWISGDQIWSKIESLFGIFIYQDISLITQYWLEKTYDLKGVRTWRFGWGGG
jgi:hypothetical protein